MTNTPLNPDALMVADEAMESRMKEFFAGLMTNGEMVDVIVSAYLAVAQPEVNSVEELDALPVGSRLIDSEGLLVTAYANTVGDRRYYYEDVPHTYKAKDITLPVQVIYRP